MDNQQQKIDDLIAQFVILSTKINYWYSFLDTEHDIYNHEDNFIMMVDAFDVITKDLIITLKLQMEYERLNNIPPNFEQRRLYKALTKPLTI
jgi:hypothetical protein